MKLDFQGIDELIKEVELLEKVPKKVKNRALKRAGDLLKDRMKREVYNHGLDKISGEARDSIVRTDPKNGELFVGTEGGVQQPGYYLYMHEFGYWNVKAKRFMPAKPFALISFELSKGQILDIYVQEIRKEMGLV